MNASSFINWYGVSDNNNQCELTNLESNKPYNCCCIFLFSPLCLSMYQVQMPEQYHLLDYFQFNNYRIVSVIRLFPAPYSFVSIKWYYKARVFFFELWHLCQFANTRASSIPLFFFITIFLPWFHPSSASIWSSSISRWFWSRARSSSRRLMSALQYMHAKQEHNYQWKACLYLPLCKDLNQNKVYLSWTSNWREKMKVRWLLELFSIWNTVKIHVETLV